MPTRRENFNSYSSVNLGNDPNSFIRPEMQLSIESKKLLPVSKYENRPKNLMPGILNPSTSKAVKESNSAKDFDSISNLSCQSN